MVLGFQGKAQLETLYGHMAEVMLSQPCDEDVSQDQRAERGGMDLRVAIGEMEVERFRETPDNARGQVSAQPQLGERSSGDVYKEVAGDGVGDRAGLIRCTGYLKYGNLVVRMRFPYLELPNRQRGVHRAASRAGARACCRSRSRKSRNRGPYAEARAQARTGPGAAVLRVTRLC